jgi:hypothetical protein
MRFRTTPVKLKEGSSLIYLKTPWDTVIRRAEIKVSLLDTQDDKVFDLSVIVDSGADVTVISSSYAVSLGVDLTRIKEVEIKGISHCVKGRPAKVKIHLPQLKDTFEIPVLFVDDPMTDMVLGREAFFDRYSIRFDTSNDYFYLIRKRSGD